MRKYIALILTSTLLYGCGGTYSFEPAPGDSTQQSPEEETSFVQLAEGHNSGYLVEYDTHLLFSTENDSTTDAAYAFMYVWLTGQEGPAPLVLFEENEAVGMVVYPRTTGGYSVEIDQVSHHENATTISVLETQPDTGENTTYQPTYPYAYPYAVALFEKVGSDDDVAFAHTVLKDGDLMQLMDINVVMQKTYQEVVREEVERRLSRQSDKTLPLFSRGSNDIRNRTCTFHEEALVEANLAEAGLDYEAYPDAPTHALFCRQGGQYWLLDESAKTPPVYGPLVPGKDREE